MAKYDFPMRLVMHGTASVKGAKNEWEARQKLGDGDFDFDYKGAERISWEANASMNTMTEERKGELEEVGVKGAEDATDPDEKPVGHTSSHEAPGAKGKKKASV